MRHDTIRRAIRHGVFVLTATFILATVSCTQPSESREVADHFMDLYYAQTNVAEAAKLCNGPALTKLQGELQAIKGMAPDASAGKPHVSFSLTASTNPTESQATYTYRVTANTSDVGPVTTTLILANEGGHWLVNLFHESEGAPTS